MKSLHKMLIAALCAGTSLTLVHAQSPSPAAETKPAAAAAATDVYHVHFAKAAAGKAAQMEAWLKKPDPKAPMPGHTIVLRHQEGEPWDYVEIEHLGPKATLDAKREPVPADVRNLGDWHNDTYVSGPSWAEFTKELGIDDASKAKTAGAMYVVSTYRAVSGQRDALEKFLSQPPVAATDKSTGGVLLQHLEGSEWNYVTVARYDSWADFATSETASVAETNKGEGGWFKLRELTASHTDTLAVRVSP